MSSSGFLALGAPAAAAAAHGGSRQESNRQASFSRGFLPQQPAAALRSADISRRPELRCASSAAGRGGSGAGLSAGLPSAGPVRRFPGKVCAVSMEASLELAKAGSSTSNYFDGEVMDPSFTPCSHSELQLLEEEYALRDIELLESEIANLSNLFDEYSAVSKFVTPSYGTECTP